MPNKNGKQPIKFDIIYSECYARVLNLFFSPLKKKTQIFYFTHTIIKSIIVINCLSRSLDGMRGCKKIDSLIDSVEAERIFVNLAVFGS